MESTHQSGFRECDVCLGDEMVETLFGGVDLIRGAFIKGEYGVMPCRRADGVFRDFHELLAATMKFALVVARQAQVEEFVVAHRARRRTGDNAHMVDEKVANRNHLVPKLEHLMDTQVSFGLLNGDAVEIGHLLFEPANLRVESETIVLIIQKSGVGLGSFGFEKVECGRHEGRSFRRTGGVKGAAQWRVSFEH